MNVIDKNDEWKVIMGCSLSGMKMDESDNGWLMNMKNVRSWLKNEMGDKKANMIEDWMVKVIMGDWWMSEECVFMMSNEEW